MLTAALGDMYSDSERFGSQPRLEEAEAEFRQALDTAERLAHEHPEVSAYQASLATIFQRRGRLARILSDRSNAEESFKRAVEIADALARSHPKSKNYQYLLAKNLRYQGQNFIHTAKLPQADKSLKAAITVLEKPTLTIPRTSKSPTCWE